MKFEELLEDSREEGREEGRTAGCAEKLQEQIQKKLAKGKDIPTIAEELEEDISTIESLLAKEETDS